MSSFGEIWKQASSEQIEPPRGNYNVKIVRGGANLSNAGDPKANVILEILDGELAGAQIDHFMWLAHPVSAMISREALVTYGLQPLSDDPEIEELDDAIQKLIGTTAEIGVSYKDGRMNIKVFKSSPPEPKSDIPTDDNGFAARAAATFGDDVPFD